MSRRLAATALVCSLAVAAPVASSGAIRVTPIVTPDGVAASFSAPAVFGDDAREVLQSGLVLTFTFFVELRRPSAIWFDHTVRSVTAASSARFDNLTGVYQVSKLRDGRVVWSERTENPAEVARWMTTFERVPLAGPGPLADGAGYYVRVRMQASPRRTFSLWPWTSDAGSGRADFTFGH
jgi:hypothetical protein